MRRIALYVLGGALCVWSLPFVAGGEYATGVVFLTLGAYFLPAVRDRAGLSPTATMTKWVAGTSFVALIFAVTWDSARLEARSRAAAAQQDAAREAARVDSLRAVFDRHGTEILTQARNALARAQADSAARLIGPFAFIDEAGLAELSDSIEAHRTRAAERIRAEEAAQRERAARERASRLQSALARLRVRSDQVEGITWYRDQGSPNSVNSTSAVYLYIGRRGQGSPWLRFVVQYVADDWLFVERLTFNIDGRVMTLAPGYLAFERDNSGGRIWEWWDTPASAEHLAIARAIADSDRTTVRHHGRQYQRDRTITPAEKRAFRNVLEAYELM